MCVVGLTLAGSIIVLLYIDQPMVWDELIGEGINEHTQSTECARVLVEVCIVLQLD